MSESATKKHKNRDFLEKNSIFLLIYCRGLCTMTLYVVFIDTDVIQAEVLL